MCAEVLVALVAGASSTAEAAQATARSIRADAGGSVRLVAYEPHPALEIEGVDLLTPEAVLEAGPILAFARPGDKWRQGAFAARLRTFAAHPSAGISVAAHAIVDANGQELLRVPAPSPPLHPAELLLRPRAEHSAVLARSALLDPLALRTIAMPHADAVVWNRIAQEHGLLASGEVAAEVPLDPQRHGYAPAARVKALLQMLSAGGWVKAPAGPELRRELLLRLYLESQQPAQAPVDLACLLPDADDRSRALIADLQWTLERQADALAAERVRWPGWAAGPDEGDEGPSELAEATIQGLQKDVVWLHTEIAYRDATVRHLNAELRRRDAIIADLDAAREEGQA